MLIDRYVHKTPCFIFTWQIWRSDTIGDNPSTVNLPQCVTGIFRPNNQYNIYWTKWSCLSNQSPYQLPRLSQDSTSYLVPLERAQQSTLSVQGSSSPNSWKGYNPAVKYRWTSCPVRGIDAEYESSWEMWVEPRSYKNCIWSPIVSTTCGCV